MKIPAFVEYNETTMEYKNINNELYITSWDGNQSIIEVPEFLDGYPVAGIYKYAFSERLDVTEVILPRSIKIIGAHAFYNCKNLRRIELHDGIRELFDGAFKNCYQLHRIIMHCHENREGRIRNMMSELYQELNLEIHYEDGQQSELVFPTYEDGYIENTPARVFQNVVYGTGGAYRQCMQVGTLDYRDFDKIFPRSVREDRVEAPIKNSVGRLLHPYKLFHSAQITYENFLKEHETEAAITLIDRDRKDGISLMCQRNCFTKEGIDGAIEYARSQGKLEILGILMQHKAIRFPIEKKSFDL